MVKNKKTITVQEAAAKAGLGRVTIRYLIDTRQMPGYVKRNQKRKSYIILRREFDAWLAGENPKTPPPTD